MWKTSRPGTAGYIEGQADRERLRLWSMLPRRAIGLSFYALWYAQLSAVGRFPNQ
jgi:hypothetical protein